MAPRFRRQHPALGALAQRQGQCATGGPMLGAAAVVRAAYVALGWWARHAPAGRPRPRAPSQRTRALPTAYARRRWQVATWLAAPETAIAVERSSSLGWIEREAVLRLTPNDTLCFGCFVGGQETVFAGLFLNRRVLRSVASAQAPLRRKQRWPPWSTPLPGAPFPAPEFAGTARSSPPWRVRSVGCSMAPLTASSRCPSFTRCGAGTGRRGAKGAGAAPCPLVEATVHWPCARCACDGQPPLKHASHATQTHASPSRPARARAVERQGACLPGAPARGLDACARACLLACVVHHSHPCCRPRAAATPPRLQAKCLQTLPYSLPFTFESGALARLLSSPACRGRCSAFDSPRMGGGRRPRQRTPIACKRAAGGPRVKHHRPRHPPPLRPCRAVFTTKGVPTGVASYGETSSQQRVALSLLKGGFDGVAGTPTSTGAPRSVRLLLSVATTDIRRAAAGSTSWCAPPPMPPSPPPNASPSRCMPPCALVCRQSSTPFRACCRPPPAPGPPHARARSSPNALALVFEESPLLDADQDGFGDNKVGLCGGGLVQCWQAESVCAAEL